jgi:hypothetical protein
MLVDHANAQGTCHHGVGDVLLSPVNHDAAFFSLLKTGNTFHQGAFARAVFPQQCMHGAGFHPHGDAVHGREAAEPFGE